MRKAAELKVLAVNFGEAAVSAIEMGSKVKVEACAELMAGTNWEGEADHNDVRNWLPGARGGLRG